VIARLKDEGGLAAPAPKAEAPKAEPVKAEAAEGRASRRSKGLLPHGRGLTAPASSLRRWRGVWRPRAGWT
jgi:hypothetical protein